MLSLARYGLFLFLVVAAWPSYAFLDWMKSSGNDDLLWHFREQYVRLEPQADNSAAPNQHPVTLDPVLLQSALASLSVLHDEQKIPLLARSELKILGDAVQRGLSKATPNQDVTFALVGTHLGMITNENRVTTGRIFFQQDRLNVIVGDVHNEIDYKEDRRLYPFLAGRRDQAKTPARPLTAQTGQQLQMNRQDWVVLDVAAAAAYQMENVQLTQQELAGKTAQVHQQNAQLTEEVSQLKSEVEALKQQPSSNNTSVDPKLQQKLSAMQAEIEALKQQPAPVAQPSVKETTASDDSIETRLRALKRLRDQELITEQVYQQKQQEILQGL